MSRRTAGMLVILAIAVLLGALREFLFINLNYQIDFLGHQREYSYAHSKFQVFVQGMELKDLVLFKWSLAGLYVLVMLLLGILLSRLLYGDHRHARSLVIGYTALALLALLFHAISNGADGWYNISVKLLHALQYPIILVFIWAGSQLASFRR